LGRFLSRLITHPELCHSKSIDSFLSATDEEFTAIKAANPIAEAQEGSTQSAPAQGASAQGAAAAAAASAFFSSVLSTVSNMATSLTTDLQEVDGSFTEKEIYLEDLRERLTILLGATTHNTQLNTQQVEQSVNFAKELDNAESYERKTAPEVSENLAKLKDVELAVADLYQKLVQNQVEMFEDALKDQIAYTQSVDRLLKNRQEALKQYQLAIATSRAKQEKSTADELIKAQEHEQHSKEQFEELSEKVKSQLELYRANKSRSVRLALRELARENIEYGEQSIAMWKDYAKSVNG